MAATAITAVVGGGRRQNKIVTSTGAPTVDNDGLAANGFFVGDIWIKTSVTVTVYICTSNATGAAVWTQLS